MKTLIFGSRGYIGKYFVSAYPEAVCPEIDIADSVAVAAVLDREHPEVVINCAGRTGRPNVDWCEDHKEETLRSNVTGPLVLLEECGKRGIYWAHMGSGCIYEGGTDRAFAESDPPNFTGSFYSKTKAWSDQILSEFPVLIFRIRMPFDGTSDPRNLINKLAGYRRVLDVQNSVTCIPDFLAAARTLIEKRAVGPFNIVNSGTVSPFDVIEMYKTIVEPSHAFEKLVPERLSEVVKAPRSNCVLSTVKLQTLGIRLRPVKEALSEALESIKQARK